MNIVREELFSQLWRMYRMPAVVKLSEFLEGETAVLLFLAEKSSGANPSIISDELMLSRARVAQIITGLKRKGYVSLLNSIIDRRKSTVRATAEGIRYIVDKRTAVEGYFDLLIAQLGEEKTRTLSKLIQEIDNAMEDTTL